MNIYLDIDGVLLVNEKSVANHADEFLQLVLSKAPDSTYWLTTHQWLGQNRAIDVLRPYLKPVTTKLLQKVKTTKWDNFKTDAIDFTKPFLWFDDDLYPKEEQELTKNIALGNYIKVDLYKNPNQLADFISSFPAPIS